MIKGYAILGGGAIAWIVAAVMCARIATHYKTDYRSAWEPMRDMHDMPARDARGSLLSMEK